MIFYFEMTTIEWTIFLKQNDQVQKKFTWNSRIRLIIVKPPCARDGLRTYPTNYRKYWYKNHFEPAIIKFQFSRRCERVQLFKEPPKINFMIIAILFSFNFVWKILLKI